MPHDNILSPKVKSLLEKRLAEVPSIFPIDDLTKHCAPTLELITHVLGLAAASLIRFDFDTDESLVIADVDGPNGNHALVRQDDTGRVYDERDFRHVYAWLHSENPIALNLHLDDMRSDTGERQEYMRYGVISGLYTSVHIKATGELWGYVELWETRYKRIFDEADIERVHAMTAYLETIIARATKD